MEKTTLKKVERCRGGVSGKDGSEEMKYKEACEA